MSTTDLRGVPVIVRHSTGWDGALSTIHGSIIGRRPSALQIRWADRPGYVVEQWFDLTTVAAIDGVVTPWAARLGWPEQKARQQ